MFTIATRNPQAPLCKNQSSIANPNDYSTINTALLRCFQLEKQNYAVITFNLPIWLKAVDLIISQRMPIIPRLGDFHLLKSYLATSGVMFADKGLHDIIKLIYEGELAADSILNGNSYDKAIREYFLIDAAILQPVIPASTFTDNDLALIKTIILDCSKNHAKIERHSNGREIQIKDQKCTCTVR